MGCHAAEPQWRLALVDAGLSSASCRRYDFIGEQSNGDVGAVWFPPGDTIPLSHHFPDAARLADANDGEHIDLHRIGVWGCADPAALGARLRHELEHAIQWEQHKRPLFQLYDLLRDEILTRKIGGLAGCSGAYINAIPSEQDANAAAAMFLRKHHPQAVSDLCKDKDRQLLACSLVGPEAIETLPARMVAYMSLHRERCADVAKSRGHSFADVLDGTFPGAGGYWQRLSVDL